MNISWTGCSRKVFALARACFFAATVLHIAVSSNGFASETTEKFRILIENVPKGEIKGSRDGGVTWQRIGQVVMPVYGAIWEPTLNGAGVLAFNFLRGESNVFATAVNALHIRFSDPEGYVLPEDPRAPLVPPHAISLAPKEITMPVAIEDPVLNKIIYTDIPGGKGIFGEEWSPQVGSKVTLGDGTEFSPIKYELGPDGRNPKRSQILIVVENDPAEIEYLDFENQAGGKVTAKRLGMEPAVVAKVLQPVLGIGRFKGSEFLPQPGVIRANHAGVLDIGTTDVNIDPDYSGGLPSDEPAINELRGGIQVVPSHHYQDQSMNSGGDHPFVYMVVGPMIDPPDLVRYDRGIDGSYPLFYKGLRGGEGKTLLQFQGDTAWYEMTEAVKAGKFVRSDGSVMKHLRGYVKDAFIKVTRIRVVRRQAGDTP